MDIHISMRSLFALIAGVVCLVAPSAFRFTVAAYLIAIAALGFLGR